MRITLYVEGGGDSKALKTECRRGFRKFFENAGLGDRMPRITACGGRGDAYGKFKIGLAAGDRIPMLLVDAEGPLTAAGPWQHLRDRKVEHVAKADVMDGLHRATRKTGKGSYRENKGSHSFMILATIDPTEVESAAPSARILLDVLRAGGPS